MIVDLPFVGPAYESAARVISAQESLNVYPETNQQSSRPRALLARPGRRLFAATAGDPRALWEMGGVPYAVFGTGVYRFSANGASTLLGNVRGADRLGVAHNGELALICSAVGNWVVSASSVSAVSDADIPVGNRVTYQNGYWLKSEGQRFGTSVIDDPFTWETLDFAQERQLPGDVVQILTDHAELLLMKSQSIGFWFESGAATGLPFDRVPQLVLNTGVVAPASVVGSLDERVFFLGQQANSTPMAFVLTGRNPQKISTSAMDVQFASYSEPEKAFAWAFVHEGHFFYVLTFPGQATWVYDVATQEWHQWSRGLGPDYDGSHAARAYGKTLVSAVGGLYELTGDATDNGFAIVRRRATAPLEAQGRAIVIDWVELECEIGTAPAGTAPEIGLDVSWDNGFTWSNARYASLGTEGDYRRRVRWTGIGSGREAVFRVSTGADARVAWTSLRAGVRVGRH